MVGCFVAVASFAVTLKWLFISFVTVGCILRARAGNERVMLRVDLSLPVKKSSSTEGRERGCTGSVAPP